ncbi:redoxin family protein [Cellulophaga sp. F20128]|nr:redoxin family protein [Cellulophaga sp. F20128]MCK0156828.1 redoxin family protein [Cellulophaga sp. F20128]
MQQRAKEKKFPFVYLADEGQKVTPKYGAVRTPHVFLLDKEKRVQYIGTFDDNAKSPENVKVHYIENAIEALENKEKPNPNFTKAIGCPVKRIQ